MFPTCVFLHMILFLKNSGLQVLSMLEIHSIDSQYNISSTLISQEYTSCSTVTLPLSIHVRENEECVTLFIGERERANLVVQLARFLCLSGRCTYRNVLRTSKYALVGSRCHTVMFYVP